MATKSPLQERAGSILFETSWGSQLFNTCLESGVNDPTLLSQLIGSELAEAPSRLLHTLVDYSITARDYVDTFQYDLELHYGNTFLPYHEKTHRHTADGFVYENGSVFIYDVKTGISRKAKQKAVGQTTSVVRVWGKPNADQNPKVITEEMRGTDFGKEVYNRVDSWITLPMFQKLPCGPPGSKVEVVLTRDGFAMARGNETKDKTNFVQYKMGSLFHIAMETSPDYQPTHLPSRGYVQVPEYYAMFESMGLYRNSCCCRMERDHIHTVMFNKTFGALIDPEIPDKVLKAMTKSSGWMPKTHQPRCLFSLCTIGRSSPLSRYLIPRFHGWGSGKPHRFLQPGVAHVLDDGLFENLTLINDHSWRETMIQTLAHTHESYMDRKIRAQHADMTDCVSISGEEYNLAGLLELPTTDKRFLVKGKTYTEINGQFQCNSRSPVGLLSAAESEIRNSKMALDLTVAELLQNDDFLNAVNLMSAEEIVAELPSWGFKQTVNSVKVVNQAILAYNSKEEEYGFVCPVCCTTFDTKEHCGHKELVTSGDCADKWRLWTVGGNWAPTFMTDKQNVVDGKGNKRVVMTNLIHDQTTRSVVIWALHKGFQVELITRIESITAHLCRRVIADHRTKVASDHGEESDNLARSINGCLKQVRFLVELAAGLIAFSINDQTVGEKNEATQRSFMIGGPFVLSVAFKGFRDLMPLASKLHPKSFSQPRHYGVIFTGLVIGKWYNEDIDGSQMLKISVKEACKGGKYIELPRFDCVYELPDYGQLLEYLVAPKNLLKARRKFNEMAKMFYPFKASATDECALADIPVISESMKKFLNELRNDPAELITRFDGSTLAEISVSRLGVSWGYWPEIESYSTPREEDSPHPDVEIESVTTVTYKAGKEITVKSEDAKTHTVQYNPDGIKALAANSIPEKKRPPPLVIKETTAAPKVTTIPPKRTTQYEGYSAPTESGKPDIKIPPTSSKSVTVYKPEVEPLRGKPIGIPVKKPFAQQIDHVEDGKIIMKKGVPEDGPVDHLEIVELDEGGKPAKPKIIIPPKSNSAAKSKTVKEVVVPSVGSGSHTGITQVQPRNTSKIVIPGKGGKLPGPQRTPPIKPSDPFASIIKSDIREDMEIGKKLAITIPPKNSQLSSSGVEMKNGAKLNVPHTTLDGKSFRAVQEKIPEKLLRREEFFHILQNDSLFTQGYNRRAILTFTSQTPPELGDEALSDEEDEAIADVEHEDRALLIWDQNGLTRSNLMLRVPYLVERHWQHEDLYIVHATLEAVFYGWPLVYIKITDELAYFAWLWPGLECLTSEEALIMSRGIHDQVQNWQSSNVYIAGAVSLSLGDLHKIVKDRVNKLMNYLAPHLLADETMGFAQRAIHKLNLIIESKDYNHHWTVLDDLRRVVETFRKVPWCKHLEEKLADPNPSRAQEGASVISASHMNEPKIRLDLTQRFVHNPLGTRVGSLTD